jgi:hypothetical protein
VLKRPEFRLHPATSSSFDRLSMRWSDFNGLDLRVSLSRFGALTVRPWATSFFSSLLVRIEGAKTYEMLSILSSEKGAL